MLKMKSINCLMDVSKLMLILGTIIILSTLSDELLMISAMQFVT